MRNDLPNTSAVGKISFIGGGLELDKGTKRVWLEKKIAPPRFELGTRDPESLMLGRYTTGLFVWYGNVGGMQQTQ